VWRGRAQLPVVAAQRLGGAGAGPGLPGTAVALVGERAAAIATSDLPGRRPHGPHQLPDAVGALRFGLLRLRPGMVRPRQPHADVAGGARRLVAGIGLEPDLAALLHDGAGRVAVAQRHRRPAATDAAATGRAGMKDFDDRPPLDLIADGVSD